MSVPATMRALQQTSLNGPQDLRLITDAPVPKSPGPGEVLIRVTAVGERVTESSSMAWPPAKPRSPTGARPRPDLRPITPRQQELQA